MQMGVLFMLAATSAFGPEPLRVGVATREITPPVGWRLAGSFSDEPSTGVHDPLRVKAMAFRQGEVRAAIVICDLTGVPREFAEATRRRIGTRNGMPLGHVTLGATHTHGAPLFYDYRREMFHEHAVAEHQGKDPREPIDYAALLADRCDEAVAAAFAAARPARLRHGVASVPGLAFNRRFHMKDGTVLFNPGKKNPAIVRPAGPVDDRLGLVLVDDAATGKPFALLSTFAMHVACFGDGTIGADFPAHLEDRLRERFGADFVSIFGEGTAGDVNHIDVKDAEAQTSAAEPRRIGGVLAKAVLEAEPGLKAIDAPHLAVASATVRAKLRPATEATAAAARDRLEKGDRLDFLQTVEAHRVLDTFAERHRHGDNLPMDLVAIRLSPDLAISTLPHEVFVELGMAIRERSPFANTLVISLCNGVDFYVPTAKAYQEGSYEVVNSRLEAGGGEILVEGAVTLLKGLEQAR